MIYYILAAALVVASLIYWYVKNNGLDKQSNKTAILDIYSQDLTQLAHEGKLDPVVGRQDEIERVIQILSRRTKNNPVLIGPSGVGKTAIVEALANKIAAGEVPQTLENKRVLSLDLGDLVAGTKYRGEFEKRLKGLTGEIIRSRREIILFIDELHTLAEAGEATGAIDAADILKPPLARGELQAIGATTLQEYKKYIAKDSTLERRFQPIMIKEPTAKETIEILKGVKKPYEEHHGVDITEEALIKAVELSEHHLKDRFFPDKAIDLVDEAAAKVKLELITHPDKYKREEKPKVTTKDIEEIIDQWSKNIICLSPHDNEQDQN